MSTVICTWKPCRSGKREVLRLREEDCRRIIEFQNWWKANGQELLDKYFGVLRREENGDLVIQDIVEYLDRMGVTWVDPDEDEDITSIPNWDKTPDYVEEFRKQEEAKREKKRRLNPTVKVVRPKRAKVDKEKEDEPKPKKKRGGNLSRRLITQRDVVKAVIKILDEGMDDDEEEGSEENKGEGDKN